MNNLLNLCWKGTLIINSIILIKNYGKIKKTIYDIYSSEINNIIFKGVCYAANIYNYITREPKLDATEFTYKCIYNNGMSNNMVPSKIHISELHDKSIESANLLDIINNFSDNPDFFIFEFVKNDTNYGLIVDHFRDNITDINTNNELLFLSTTLKHNNIDYTIDMKKPINYNIKTNNVLGNNFVKYYAKEYLNVKITDDYKVEIMDNNLNIIHLTKKNYINITDGSYTLENNEKEEINELIEEIVDNFEISNQESDNQEPNLQINIAEFSPVSNSSVSNNSIEYNLSPMYNISSDTSGSTMNYLNRKCGICREVGHTRKKCPKAKLPF